MSRTLLVCLTSFVAAVGCVEEDPPPPELTVPPSRPEFARAPQPCRSEKLDDDGALLERVSNRFDPDGRLLRSIAEDFVVHTLVDTVSFRDIAGRVRDQESYTRKTGADGYGHAHFLFDENGAPTGSREGGFDDRIDILLGTYQLDDQGRIAVIDRRTQDERLAADRLENFAYDVGDRLIHYDYDLEIDGSLEVITDVSYDGATEVWDQNDSGGHYQQTITRDGFGEVVRWEIDLELDGSVNYSLVADLDTEGRILGYQADEDGDGTVDRISTFEDDEERRVVTTTETGPGGTLLGTIVNDFACLAPPVDDRCPPGFFEGALGCARWRMAAAMDHGRVAHQVFLRADGTLIALGGVGGSVGISPPITEVETIDVAANEPVAGAALQTLRIQEAAALLPDGRVVIAGGFDGANDLVDVLVYDFPAGEAPGPTLTSARRRAQIVVFDDGEVLVAGGFDRDTHHLSAERFHVDDATTSPAGRWRAIHRDASLTRVDADRAVAVGGLTYGSVVAAETEVYDRRVGTWQDGPDLVVPRQAHGAAALADGRLMVVGGEDSDGQPLADVEVLDIDGQSASLLAPLPMPLAELHLAVLPGDVVLVAGGRAQAGERAGVSPATFVYDAANDIWERGPDLGVERYAGRLVTLADGSAAMVGGSVDEEQTTAAVEVLEVAP
ncbi:MAG: hypothetical protein HYS27_00810 [Deltaproteobacteria bacterium]|nr:hypothetical protein [Deltaproteobacteria bacterium]